MPDDNTPNDLGSRHWKTQAWPRYIATETHLSGADLINGWATWLGHFPWQWFATLTFDPKRVYPVSQTVVEREASRWCQLVGRTVRLQVGWVCAPERGRGGQWHAHVVMLANSETWSPTAALPVWETRNGRIDLRPVHDLRGLGLYLTKDAAEAGTIVLSDTLVKYKPSVPTPSLPVVPLVTVEYDTETRQVGSRPTGQPRISR
jgi:hypothetical protein